MLMVRPLVKMKKIPVARYQYRIDPIIPKDVFGVKGPVQMGSRREFPGSCDLPIDFMRALPV
jgi:hypothetical protein